MNIIVIVIANAVAIVNVVIVIAIIAPACVIDAVIVYRYNCLYCYL